MNTATATDTRTKCDHCDELVARIVQLEDALLDVHTTALAAVSPEERYEAIITAASTIK